MGSRAAPPRGFALLKPRRLALPSLGLRDHLGAFVPRLPLPWHARPPPVRAMRPSSRGNTDDRQAGSRLPVLAGVGQWSLETAEPMVWTRRALVEPWLPGGEPATMTTLSPFS